MTLVQNNEKVITEQLTLKTYCMERVTDPKIQQTVLECFIGVYY